MTWVSAGVAGAGAVAGFLGSGSSGDATSISGFKALPKNVKLDLRDAIDKSQADFAQGPQQFFGGQTFADLTPDQLAGLQSQLGFSQNQLPQQLAGINQSFLMILPCRRDLARLRTGQTRTSRKTYCLSYASRPQAQAISSQARQSSLNDLPVETYSRLSLMRRAAFLDNS